MNVSGSLTPQGAYSQPPEGGPSSWQWGQDHYRAAGSTSNGIRIHPVSVMYQPEPGATMNVFMNGVLMTLLGTWTIPPDETGVATTSRDTAVVQLWDCGDAIPETVNQF